MVNRWHHLVLPQEVLVCHTPSEYPYTPGESNVNYFGHSVPAITEKPEIHMTAMKSSHYLLICWDITLTLWLVVANLAKMMQKS